MTGHSDNGLAYDVVVKLMQPFLNQGYRLFVDNFYTSITLFKTLFTQGTPATGTVIETRRGFPLALKNGKEWARKKERGSMRWEWDAPVLALQWIDNKVVSLLTTIDNANDKIQVQRKTKKNDTWNTKVVYQPKAVSNYNKYMNAVDRSDQILATNNILHKCMRWWKTLFFHLIDIAVVNSFILFKEHQANNPDEEALHRPNDYSLSSFREEIVRQLCGFEEYDQPPSSSRQKYTPRPGEFEALHVPEFSEKRKRCVVCLQKKDAEGKGKDTKVFSFCPAPQCGRKFMHVTKQRNCFKEFHTREYHS